MRSRRRKLLGLAALLSALAGLTATAAFGGWVKLETWNFAKRSDVRDMEKSAGGQSCSRRWAERNERLRVIARQGPATCLLELPASGADGPPNHALRVDARVPSGIQKAVRRNAELILRTRSGGGTYYELRVQPVGRAWTLRRSGTVIDSGTNGAIGTPGQLNKMRLEARDDKVRAFVNGVNLLGGRYVDPDPPSGISPEFGIRHGAETSTRLDVPVDLVRLSLWFKP